MVIIISEEKPVTSQMKTKNYTRSHAYQYFRENIDGFGRIRVYILVFVIL